VSKKCTTISFVNQKGGVGKTVSTYNIAWSLAKQGKKVIVIDLDPQGNLTMQSGIFNPDDLDTTITTVMRNFLFGDSLIPKSEFIIKSGIIDLIPANIELSDMEIQLVTATTREFILDKILNEYKIKDEYDYILIDCMPSLLMLPINALATSDYVIIPVNLEYWATKGIESLLKSVVKIRKYINHRLSVAGILITKYSPSFNLTKSMFASVESVFGEKINIYEAKIPNTVKIQEACSFSLSLDEYSRKIKDEKIKEAVDAYERVAKVIAEMED